MRILVTLALVLSLANCAPRKATQPTPQALPSECQSAVYEKASKPGPEHKVLGALVGNWQATSKMWVDGSNKPIVAKGKAKNTLTLGGRFLNQEYSAVVGKEKFRGQGNLGFDRVSDQYVSTWADTMSTGIMSSTGSFNSKTKSLTMNGATIHPVTKQTKNFEEVTRLAGKNKYTFEMYERNADGSRKKVLEIDYKRVKG